MRAAWEVLASGPVIGEVAVVVAVAVAALAVRLHQRPPLCALWAPPWRRQGPGLCDLQLRDRRPGPPLALVLAAPAGLPPLLLALPAPRPTPPLQPLAEPA